MAIVLNRLAASGPALRTAEVVFHPLRCLIRGPSDTGKSYIRDCLWYLLGGSKLPKSLPEAEGYASLSLEFTSDDDHYQVHRGIAGGAAALFKMVAGADGLVLQEPVDEDEGELLVRLAAAEGRKILRSMSAKGGVTGGDLRHWFLLSQTDIISEEPTGGIGVDKTQRVAAFNLILTGSDDEAIQLVKSKSEVDRIVGQLGSAEDSLKRLQAGIPPDANRQVVDDALTRVDDALSEMTNHYQARAAHLMELRESIAETSNSFFNASAARDHSASMVERFQLLDEKYASDLERLGATGEGIALFGVLPETPCPLCGTAIEKQVDPGQLRADAPTRYRQAIAAEAAKIHVLRRGLTMSLEEEKGRLANSEESVRTLHGEFKTLQNREAIQLKAPRIEFTSDPKTLALRRSDLAAQINIFDEVERLEAEIGRLKNAKVRRRVAVVREGGAAGAAVAKHAHELLNQWGFHDVVSVTLDPLECDLVINERQRLSYGAGKRALFLTALTVGLLHHALVEGHPHLGVVVIDSPLKAYADPTLEGSESVAVATVTDNFYRWLSQWTGPGQIIVLENEKISDEIAAVLEPIQFSAVDGQGREGFYPRTTSTHSDSASRTSST